MSEQAKISAVSHAYPSSRQRPAGQFTGLPTWSAISIMVAGLLTGLVISFSQQEISLFYLVIFLIATVTVTMLVEVRGLFLTVVAIPLLFAVMTVISAWTVTRSLAAEGTAPFSTTSILTAVYPLTQYFPWLLTVTVICLVIAVLRVSLVRRTAHNQQVRERRRSRRALNRDRRTLNAAAHARGSSPQVTVEELLARSRQDGAARRESRPRRRR